MRRLIARRIAAVVAVALALGAAGCGSGDARLTPSGASTPPSGPPSSAAVELDGAVPSEPTSTRFVPPTTTVPTGAGEVPSTTTTSTWSHEDERGGVDGPVLYAPKPASPGAELARIEGTLEREGDCLFVTSAGDATQGFAVMWPYGTRWQDDPAGVLLPDGTIVEVDRRFTAGGGYHRAPTFTPDRFSRAVVERVATCAGDPWREVAVVQADVAIG